MLSGDTDVYCKYCKKCIIALARYSFFTSYYEKMYCIDDTATACVTRVGPCALVLLNVSVCFLAIKCRGVYHKHIASVHGCNNR